MPLPVHYMTWSRENFSGHLKHRSSRRRCAISSGDRRLNRLTAIAASLSGAPDVAGVEPGTPAAEGALEVDVGVHWMGRDGRWLLATHVSVGTDWRRSNAHARTHVCMSYVFLQLVYVLLDNLK